MKVDNFNLRKYLSNNILLENKKTNAEDIIMMISNNNYSALDNLPPDKELLKQVVKLLKQPENKKEKNKINQMVCKLKEFKGKNSFLAILLVASSILGGCLPVTEDDPFDRKAEVYFAFQDKINKSLAYNIAAADVYKEIVKNKIHSLRDRNKFDPVLKDLDNWGGGMYDVKDDVEQFNKMDEYKTKEWFSRFDSTSNVGKEVSSIYNKKMKDIENKYKNDSINIRNSIKKQLADKYDFLEF